MSTLASRREQPHLGMLKRMPGLLLRRKISKVLFRDNYCSVESVTAGPIHTTESMESVTVLVSNGIELKRDVAWGPCAYVVAKVWE